MCAQRLPLLTCAAMERKGSDRWRRGKVIAMLCGLVLLFAGWTAATAPRVGPHSALDLLAYGSDRSSSDGLVVMYSSYFATAGRCSGCHGRDTSGLAMHDSDGVDVNVSDDWRSTMMANSARDPFFRAKASHEVLVNPGAQVTIENKCLGCHAPLGMHEERMLGNPPFTIANLDTSTMGLNGVSCLACHQQKPETAGHYFSGELQFGPEHHNAGDSSARVYGPYADDEINAAIMTFFVGFRPGYGQHIQDGRVCAGCHTLITQTHDLSGSETGGEFIEQATWQEWKNSIYVGDPATTCRGCHIPRINDYVILASEYAFLPGHTPFGKHHLAGGNSFMLKLMKDHKDDLGIPATDTQFDSTISRTLKNLHHSVDLTLHVTDRTSDTLFVNAALENLTGHKFPSGYPSRRAFVQVIALNGNGDTLFQSGRWDANYEVYGHDIGYEPHHDIVKQNGDVQIYELVMGDVNNNVTTTLERAASALKDNRLVPHGFSTSHPSYDTTVIAGVPASDIDFDHDALNVEGNGGDIVHYHIPLGGYSGVISVHARVYYQPVPPLWNQEMFSYNSAAIDTFRTMYHNADGTPELVASDSLSDNSLAIAEHGSEDVRVFPDPTSDGLIAITGADISRITVYDAVGKRVEVTEGKRANGWWCKLPDTPGVYHVIATTSTGDRLRRVVRTSDR